MCHSFGIEVLLDVFQILSSIPVSLCADTLNKLATSSRKSNNSSKSTSWRLERPECYVAIELRTVSERETSILFCTYESNSRCKPGFGQSSHLSFSVRNRSSLILIFPSFQLRKKPLAETVLKYWEKLEDIEKGLNKTFPFGYQVLPE